jgi:hypothetical protein
MQRQILAGEGMTRRTCLKNLALTLAVGVVVARRSPGAELSQLDVKDPAAVAVGYVDAASKVDRKKYPSYVPGSTCENCLLLQGSAGAPYRPCNLFPGKLVASAGWCSGWTAEI